ncbi:hypothetical protein PR202_gb21705 [Eleusine coracana subsp. coracana]|uniref:DUF6598 domain-containing protein n=1 Tax=Eleusine coracana subsp. coracana TaxID=191504 RepID=A0AAV5FE33_ELECO|nr:hypothetical protein PR202_gb21705 [Eleusine coracana subsp. coracana]
MDEPKLMWWEKFVEGLEEAVPECPVKKNEAVQGEEGWKKHEINQLSELWIRVSDKKSEECEEVYRKRMMESGYEEKGLDKSDLVVQRAIGFREVWNSNWHGLYGSFDDVSLQWPLHVFGMVAVRDPVDRNRNLLFYRTRDNCQTLSEAEPHLVLTGPTRTVVVAENDYVIFEIYLKVKGDTENEDKHLFYCVDQLPFFGTSYIPGSSVDNVSPFRCYSKHGILEIRLGEIRSSVEATIFVRVVDGTWPDGFHGHFAARTSSERQNVVLLDFGAAKVPVDGDGYMNLSRQVVSVELEGSLEVRFMAWRDDKPLKECQDDNEVVTGEVRLKPEKAGRSYASLRLDSCEMEVLVAWSQVLPEPQPDVPDSFEDYP